MLSSGRRRLLLPLFRPSQSASSHRCLAPRTASFFSSSSFSSKSSGSKALDAFATVDPDELSGKNPSQVYNLGECVRGDGEGGRGREEVRRDWKDN